MNRIGGLELVIDTPAVHESTPSTRRGQRTILDEAAELTAGDRHQSYGHPLDDFSVCGRIQAAILSRWLGQTVPDLPAEVSVLLMQAVKISRELHVSKRDNAVDGAGYWRLVEMIHEERAARTR